MPVVMAMLLHSEDVYAAVCSVAVETRGVNMVLSLATIFRYGVNSNFNESAIVRLGDQRLFAVPGLSAVRTSHLLAYFTLHTVYRTFERPHGTSSEYRQCSLPSASPGSRSNITRRKLHGFSSNVYRTKSPVDGVESCSTAVDNETRQKTITHQAANIAEIITCFADRKSIAETVRHASSTIGR